MYCAWAKLNFATVESSLTDARQKDDDRDWTSWIISGMVCITLVHLKNYSFSYHLISILYTWLVSMFDTTDATLHSHWYFIKYASSKKNHTKAAKIFFLWNVHVPWSSKKKVSPSTSVLNSLPWPYLLTNWWVACYQNQLFWTKEVLLRKIMNFSFSLT
jgi:hypothetical protein